MRKILSITAAIVVMTFSSILTAQAGGYSRSEAELTATFLAAVIGRIYTLETLGYVMPVRAASECRFGDMKKLNSAEILASHVRFVPSLTKPQCRITRVVSIKEDSAQVAYPAVVPCHQIDKLLREIVIEKKYGLIEVHRDRYPSLGITGPQSSSISLYFQLDNSDVPSSERKLLYDSMARIQSWSFSQQDGYCTITAQM